MKDKLKKINSDKDKAFQQKLANNKKERGGSSAKNNIKETEEDSDNDYYEISLSQAFYLFVETKLKPLHKKMQVRWQEFRDEELWVESVQKVLTLNETGLRALYDRYTPTGYSWLTIADCERLMVEDSPLEVSREIVLQAYAMSKQTVVNEREEKQYRAYNKLNFVEFLEFIARVTDMAFAGSELEDIPLDEKLEYSLTDWLPLVHHRYQRNRIVVQEVSDSDEDY